MAFAARSGLTGAVTIGGLTAHFRSWSLSHSQATIDVTNYDSSGDREIVPGIVSWSGTAEAFMSTDTTNSLADTTLQTYSLATFTDANSTAEGVTYTGSILITDITWSPSVDGACSLTIAFDGHQALTAAASA